MAGPGSPDNQPLKLAGYGLLGVAAIAAVVGLVSLASGGSEAAPVDPALQAPPSSSVVTPPPLTETTPAAPPPAAPAVPAPNQLASPSTTAALPGAGLPESGGTGGSSGSKSVAKAPVRVYNNSTVSGLADRAADDIRDSGWSVTEVGNWPFSTIASSTVYYRNGTSEQAAARNLASSFGLRAEPRFGGIKDASPGLIVIVTKDYQRR
jgi:hypothetical protein